MAKKDVFELYPTKRIAPAILGYASAVLYVVVAVLLFTGLIKLTNDDKTVSFILFGIAGGIIVLLFIAAHSFAWERKSEIYKKGDTIRYDVFDIVAGMGNGKTEYEIEDITDVKYNSRTDKCELKCKIYPKGREKKAKNKKVVINFCTQEAYNFLKKEIKG